MASASYEMDLAVPDSENWRSPALSVVKRPVEDLIMWLGLMWRSIQLLYGHHDTIKSSTYQRIVGQIMKAIGLIDNTIYRIPQGAALWTHADESKCAPSIASYRHMVAYVYLQLRKMVEHEGLQAEFDPIMLCFDNIVDCVAIKDFIMGNRDLPSDTDMIAMLNADTRRPVPFSSPEALTEFVASRSASNNASDSEGNARDINGDVDDDDSDYVFVSLDVPTDRPRGRFARIVRRLFGSSRR